MPPRALTEYRRLQELDDRSEGWEALLDEAIAEIDHDLAGRALPAADEMIRGMREDRDAELLDCVDASLAVEPAPPGGG